MFKFLHAADIHLDSPLHKLDHYEGAPVEEIRQATRRTFENLINLAIAQKVAFVLLAGDLYDGDWKDYNTGLYFTSQMSKLREAGIPVYIIAGNHDAASKITKTLKLPEGVKIFSADTPETVRVDEPDVAIHGQSFASPSVKKDISSGYPYAIEGCFNIGMLHTCVTGMEGHEPYAPCTLDGLQSRGYDYWALGHVHKHEVLLETPLTIFPGNIQGRNIRETGPKGCVLVTVDERRRPYANFKPLDVIRWFEIETDVSAAETGYDVVVIIGEHLERLLDENQELPLVVRLKIVGESRAHNELASDMERWTSELRSAAGDMSGGKIWIEKVKLHTQPPIEMMESMSGPMAELIQYLDELRADPELLRTLTVDIEDLRKKLPGELMEGEDALRLDDAEWLAGVLEEVQPMLIHRLLKEEGSK
ncbi:MAG: DNA repair exonuclease [Methanosarcinales archaeon]|nr:DNA repair exonuclease [Methanosarcinales archaeon]